MTDALVEAVALSLGKAAIALSAEPDDRPETLTANDVRRLATAALQAIEAAGYRVVPVEATEGMIVEAEDAAWDHDNHMPAIRAMRLAWSAMLSAAPRVGEGV